MGGHTPFASVLGELGLTDVWRCRHLETKKYSCYSASHKGLSRMHMGLGNDAMLQLVTALDYADRHV